VADDKIVFSWEDDPTYTDKSDLKEQRLMVSVNAGEYTQVAIVDNSKNSHSVPLTDYAGASISFRVDRVKTDDTVVPSDVVELVIAPNTTKDYDFLGYVYGTDAEYRDNENMVLLNVKTSDGGTLPSASAGSITQMKDTLEAALNEAFGVSNIFVDIEHSPVDSYSNYVNLINKDDIDRYFGERYTQLSFDNGVGSTATLSEFKLNIANIPENCSVTIPSFGLDSLLEATYPQDVLGNTTFSESPIGNIRMCQDTITYSSAGREINVVENTGIPISVTRVTDATLHYDVDITSLPSSGSTFDISQAPVFTDDILGVVSKIIKVNIPENEHTTLTVTNTGDSGYAAGFTVTRHERYLAADPTKAIPSIGISSIHLLDHTKQHGIVTGTGPLVINLNPPAGRLIGEILIAVNANANDLTFIYGDA
jgi:hypothetical protein